MGQETSKILVVDDDMRLRSLLERYLIEHGYQVRTAANGEQMDRALKCGANGKPIMFDLQNTWLKGEQYAHIL